MGVHAACGKPGGRHAAQPCKQRALTLGVGRWPADPVHLIAAPFYILLQVTSVGPLILFVIVNRFAFERDIGELAAATATAHRATPSSGRSA